MTGFDLGGALIPAAIVLIALVVTLVAHRRSSGPHRKATPSSPSRVEAEEERDRLKGGSLWGDVYQPRFVPRRPRRRR